MSLYRATGGGGKAKFASIVVGPNTATSAYKSNTYTLTEIPNYKDLVLYETLFIDPSYSLYVANGTTSEGYGGANFSYNAEKGVLSASMSNANVRFLRGNLTVYYAV